MAYTHYSIYAVVRKNTKVQQLTFVSKKLVIQKCARKSSLEVNPSLKVTQTSLAIAFGYSEFSASCYLFVYSFQFGSAFQICCKNWFLNFSFTFQSTDCPVTMNTTVLTFTHDQDRAKVTHHAKYVGQR